MTKPRAPPFDVSSNDETPGHEPYLGARSTRRIDDLVLATSQDRPRRLAMLADRPRSPRLVLAHQARIADDIDGENRGEAASRGHCSGTPAMRRPSKMGSSWAR